MDHQWTEQDFLSCCGSARFAAEMAAAAPFPDLDAAVRAARDIWLNRVDVKGCLEAFAAHPEIGSTSKSISQWSKEEQSTAAATATDSTLKELVEWNVRYREKFGFVFLICASGRGTAEILAELKRRYTNRPIVELEIASQEQMKILELRLAKLFQSEARASHSVTTELPLSQPNKPGEESAEFTSQRSRVFVQAESSGKRSRGTSFTVEEDVLLVWAWLNTSLGAIHDNGQKNKAFWTRMWEYFHKYRRFNSNRGERSLMNRWSQIQLATKKFCSSVTQVESLHESGVDEQDKIDKAKRLYRESNSEKQPFRFDHCWNILRHQPKWLREIQKTRPTKKYKSATSSSSTPNAPVDVGEEVDVDEEDDPTTDFVELERPPGRNIEKDRLSKRKHKDHTGSSTPNAPIDVGEEDDPTTDFVELERPPGRNIEKDRLSKRKHKDHTGNSVIMILNETREEKKQSSEKKKDLYDRTYLQEELRIGVEKERLILEQKRIAHEEEKHRLEQMKEEERVMLINTTGMPPMVSDFYHRRQVEILARQARNR